MIEIIFFNSSKIQLYAEDNQIKTTVSKFIDNLKEIKNNKYLISLQTKNLNLFINCCNKIEELKINCEINELLNLEEFTDLKKISLNTVNVELIKLPNNIEEIIISEPNFNSPLSNLSSNLKILKFENDLNKKFKFSQPLNNLPLSLEELRLCEKITHSVDNLPENLKILELYDNSNNDHHLNNLPIGLEELIIHNFDFEKINNLPPNLKILKILDINNYNKNKIIFNLSSKLEKLFTTNIKIISNIIDSNYSINIEELHFIHNEMVHYYCDCCGFEPEKINEHIEIIINNILKIINNKNMFKNLKNIIIYENITESEYFMEKLSEKLNDYNITNVNYPYMYLIVSI